MGKISASSSPMGEVSAGDVRIVVLLVEDGDFDIGMEV
jgi:hypothetical protein